MNRALIAVALVALTAALRVHPFLEGNDDGDVGVYVLAARAWLHGILPYAAVWEYKPPGLFALFAVALAAVGDGSRASGLLGLAAAAATTLIVWRLVARIVPNGERAGLVAAILWACISIENDGMLGDAELLAIPFVAGSLLALTGRPSLTSCAFSGLLAACALQMKLSEAPVLLAPAVAAVVVRGAVAVPAFGGAFLVPPAIECVVYGLAHRLGDLYDANVGATLRRIVSRGVAHPTRPRFAAELRLLAPALYLAPFAALRANRGIAILALWLALAGVTLVAVGEYDARQVLPLVPPIAALAGIGLDALARRVRAGGAVVAAVLVPTFFLHGYFEVNSALRIVWMRDVRGQRDWRISDVDRTVARLRGVPLARGGAWFMEETPLVYDELGLTPPTRYPLTSNLLSRSLWPMLGMSGAAELARIVDCARPRWIVVKRCGPWCDPATRDATLARIRRSYRVTMAVDRRTVLYRRIDGAASHCASRR